MGAPLEQVPEQLKEAQPTAQKKAALPARRRPPVTVQRLPEQARQ